MEISISATVRHSVGVPTRWAIFESMQRARFQCQIGRCNACWASSDNMLAEHFCAGYADIVKWRRPISCTTAAASAYVAQGIIFLSPMPHHLRAPGVRSRRDVCGLPQFGKLIISQRNGAYE